jgi:hypothetical protein
MADTTLIITITDHSPVNIVKADWPIKASASSDDATQPGNQPNREWKLKVRQHADGRSIVYGVYTTAWQNESDTRSGRIVEAGGDLIAAIHDVADLIGAPELADRCIAKLPAVDLK